MVLIEPRTEGEACIKESKGYQVDESCYSLRMEPMEEEVLGRTVVDKILAVLRFRNLW